MLVVAGALFSSERGWLLHRRPLGKHHGGRWEFPGGKVEDHEHPISALIRELREELAIDIEPGGVSPVGFAASPLGDQPMITLLLYTCTVWAGEPIAQEGGDIAWYTPDAVQKLDLTPLDRLLCASLFSNS